MKKLILLPVLGILSVALFSFKSASSDGHIVRCEDGTVIIPSSCAVTDEDQNAILAIMAAHGPNAGYASYTDAAGESHVYNPTPVSALVSVDERYGTDLATSSSFVGWCIFENKIDKDIITSRLVAGSASTMAMNAELAPILAKYE